MRVMISATAGPVLKMALKTSAHFAFPSKNARIYACVSSALDWQMLNMVYFLLRVWQDSKLLAMGFALHGHAVMICPQACMTSKEAGRLTVEGTGCLSQWGQHCSLLDRM